MLQDRDLYGEHVTKFSSTIRDKLGSPDSSVSIATSLGLEDTGLSPGRIKGILFFFFLSGETSPLCSIINRICM